MVRMFALQLVIICLTPSLIVGFRKKKAGGKADVGQHAADLQGNDASKHEAKADIGQHEVDLHANDVSKQQANDLGQHSVDLHATDASKHQIKEHHATKSVKAKRHKVDAKSHKRHHAAAAKRVKRHHAADLPEMSEDWDEEPAIDAFEFDDEPVIDDAYDYPEMDDEWDEEPEVHHRYEEDADENEYLEEEDIPGVDDRDDGEYEFVGVSGNEEEMLRIILKDESNLLQPTDVSSSVCNSLHVGAQAPGCEDAHEDGDVCKCKFMGAKPMYCDKLFKHKTQVYHVVRNEKLAVFKKSGCHCTYREGFPVKSECTFAVGK